jgi:hypothetical protein
VSSSRQVQLAEARRVLKEAVAAVIDIALQNEQLSNHLRHAEALIAECYL